MLLRAAKYLLVLALSFSIGAHWAVLQSVAWVGMAVSYSQTEPLSEALTRTFDGQHPCRLCCLVAQGKKAEQRQAAQKAEYKLDLFCAARPLVYVLQAAALNRSCADLAPLDRLEAPPSPPPRSVSGNFA